MSAISTESQAGWLRQPYNYVCEDSGAVVYYHAIDKYGALVSERFCVMQCYSQARAICDALNEHRLALLAEPHNGAA